jgi:hypothetical protein
MVCITEVTEPAGQRTTAHGEADYLASFARLISMTYNLAYNLAYKSRRRQTLVAETLPDARALGILAHRRTSNQFTDMTTGVALAGVSL